MDQVLINGDTLSSVFMLMSAYVLMNFLQKKSINIFTVSAIVLESVRRIIAFLKQME